MVLETTTCCTRVTTKPSPSLSHTLLHLRFSVKRLCANARRFFVVRFISSTRQCQAALDLRGASLLHCTLLCSCAWQWRRRVRSLLVLLRTLEVAFSHVRSAAAAGRALDASEPFVSVVECSSGDPPCPRHGHTAVVDERGGGRMLVFGGCNDSGEFCSDLYLYNIGMALICCATTLW